MKATLHGKGGGVYQISLTPSIAGFADFISAWLVTGEATFLVDVGPASTADQLIGALESLPVSRLDYILLTHIHLDHAGAVGQVSSRFPQAKILCHPAGIPHLVDPAALWEGTRKVLGSVALGYGPLEPVPAVRFVSAEGFGAAGITAVLTPGHAPHHVSFLTKACLFAGEACGVYYQFPCGRDYMRPATPPKFLMNRALESIDTLISLAPTRMVIGHTGLVSNGESLLRRHRGQLISWEQWIRTCRGALPEEEAVQHCLAELMRQDPCLAGFSQFAPAAQEREKYFLGNSIKGFWGWVRNSEDGRGE